MARTRTLLLALVAVLAGPMSGVLADALIVSRAMKAASIAEIYVEEDGVRVELAIGVTDLNAFRNLMPDEIYRKLGHPPK
ncbi:MAG: hypothetical protein ACYTAS_23320, partial [Planctomycetota bacterium]